MKKQHCMHRVLAFMLALVMLTALLPVSVLGADAYAGSLTRGKPATASAQVSSSESAANAVDGNTGTKWCSTAPVDDDSADAQAGAKCHWLAVDLGSEKTVTEWLVHSTIDGGILTSQIVGNFKLQVKDADGAWQTAASVTGNKELTYRAKLETAVTGRYFRLWLPGSGCNQPDGDSYPRVGEFHLFGDSTEEPGLPAPYTDSLTYGKSVRVSAQAAPAETAENTVDANPATKWAALGKNAGAGNQAVADDSLDAEPGATCHWLEVDLGEEQTVRSWLVYSAIDPGWTDQISSNFKLQVKTADGWQTAASVTGNRDQMFRADLETAVAGRYFRLWLPGSGCNRADDHARIGEFHLFAAWLDGTTDDPASPYARSLTAGKTAAASSEVNSAEGAEKAFDKDENTKWCAIERIDDGTDFGGYWLEVDLGEEKTVRRWEVLHTNESSAWVTRDFDLQVKTADGSWRTVSAVSGNSKQRYAANLTEAASGRYFRLAIHCTAAQQSPGRIDVADTANYARIREFHLYASTDPALDVNTEPKEHNLDYVNPLIGTQDLDHTQNNAGSTPYVSPPFAMTNFYANTREYRQGIDAYSYDDTGILGIVAGHRPMLHMGDYGQISVMAQTGEIRPAPADRRLSFDTVSGVKQETATPYYYSADLGKAEGSPVHLTFTSTERCSILQFTYTADSANVLVEAARSSSYKDGYIQVDAEKNEITGYSAEYEKAAFLNMQDVPELHGYFVIQFSEPMTGFGTFQNYAVTADSDSASGKGLGAYASFDTSKNKTVEVRIGTSFISVEQARANLRQELGEMTDENRQSFAQVSENLKKTWAAKLDLIDIESKDEDAKTIFYTALYHALQLPRQIHEWVGGVYDHETNTYTAGKPVHQSFFNTKNAVYDGYAYADIACWDIFRAEFSMLTLLAPEQVSRITSGLLNAYEEGGYMPKWPNPGYTSVMIGTHADSLIAEALGKGFLTGVTDPAITERYNGKSLIEEAYAAVWKDAMVPQEGDGTTYKWKDWAQNEPYEARGGLTAYKAFGYIPNDFVAENVSRTLEHAYDDYCAALVARAAGDENAYKWFRNRSLNYKNVIDPATGLSSGRDYQGNFGGGSYTEGSAVQYTFFNPHDPVGLAELMDAYKGEGFFVKTLQAAFDQGQLWHGNEPSHGHAYLFNFVGRPDLTQKYVRQTLRSNYWTSYNGMSGNDDCGQMSAWYMFSAMGFYPFNPVSGEYQLTSPIFDKVSIHVPLTGKDFVISAKGADDTNVYIQSASLNGEALNEPVLSWQTLTSGGELSFTLGKTASDWGSSYAPAALTIYEEAENPEAEYEPPYFADSTVTVQSGSLRVKYSEPQDITFAVTYITNRLTAVTLDGTALAEGTDYTFTNHARTELVIPAETLVSAGKGVFTLRFVFNQGASPSFQLTVADTPRELLEGLLLAADKMDTAPYTFVSLEVLQRTVEKARALLQEPDVSDAQLEAMQSELSDAFDALKLWPVGYEGSLTLGRDVTVSAQVSDKEAGKFAVDADINTKWCSLKTEAIDGWHWLEVDLGSEKTVASWMIHNSGHYDPGLSITKIFSLQVWDGSDWKTVETVTGNTQNVFRAELSEPVTGQRFRLLVPAENNDYDGSNAVRIHEFHLFGPAAEAPTAVELVEAQIAAIGTVTLESEQAIVKAREAFDALTPEEQAQVRNLNELTAAEQTLAALKQAAADEAAAAVVRAMIDALPKPASRSDEVAVRAARSAYDALTPAQQALVDNLQTLLDAERAIAAPIPGVLEAVTAQKKLPFTDVDTQDWFYDAVRYVYENGLMSGTAKTLFQPSGAATRGMIVTILARIDNVRTDRYTPWYEAGRVWAVANGISDGTNMTGLVTREQLAAILYRYAISKGYDTTRTAALDSFTDASSVSSWAQSAMQWAVGTGLISGRSNRCLAPQGTASRAEIAAILTRFLK